MRLEFSDGEALCIGRFPNRKQACIYHETGNVATVLAYFRTDDAEAYMKRVLEKLARACMYPGRGATPEKLLDVWPAPAPIKEETRDDE